MSELNLTSYDPTELKQDLIAFMQSKPEFADFNYEGSTLNTLIDLLVRQGHYIAFMANMMSNESFLDTAQLRHNVVSHAQKLSYVPRSKTSATARISLTVTPPDNYTENAPFIVGEKGRVFVTSIDGETYYFTNPDQMSLFRFPDGTYRVNDVEIKQGSLIRTQFTYNSTQAYVDLDDPNMDTSTVRVSVRNQADATPSEFVKVEDIVQTTKNGQFYFLTETTQEKHRIEFGKDILGVEPPNNAVIEVEYVSVENGHANGIEQLDAATPINIFSDVDVTVDVPSYGGSERESINRIKFLAPKTHQSNNRAVKEIDFPPLMMRDFNFIRTASAWGGEKNNPPYYGQVMISAVPEEGVVILDYLKRAIVDKMNTYAVGSITTTFVDPVYFGIDLDVSVKVDRTRTSSKPSQITPIIQDIVKQYADKNLKFFSAYYNNSQAINAISNLDYIETVELDKKVFTELDSVLGTVHTYQVDFGNAFIPQTLTIEGVVVDSSADNEKIYDDGAGNVIYEKIVGSTSSTEIIGSVNYETGYIQLTYAFVSGNTIKVTVVPVSDNFYTAQNQVVYLDNIEVEYV